MTLERILRGVLPTDVFQEMLAREPGLTNSELARAFTDYFEDVDWLAKQVIWKWNRSRQRDGIDDEQLNARLIKLLREAGYPVRVAKE